MGQDAEQLEQRPDRREACRSALRYLALGGVALLSAGMIGGRGRSSAEQSCCTPSACRNCAAAAGCRLPQAQAAKRRTRR